MRQDHGMLVRKRLVPGLRHSQGVFQFGTFPEESHGLDGVGTHRWHQGRRLPSPQVPTPSGGGWRQPLFLRSLPSGDNRLGW